jgi:hypothetical protein
MMRSIAIPLLVLAATMHLDAAQTFRAATHAVAVEVAVFDGDRVVTGLTAADFEIRDNGVRQKVAEVEFNTLPVDLRLVFDVSGSITPDQLEWYSRAMRQVAAKLEPRDRCEIIAFNARIADVASRQHPPVVIDLSKHGGREGTSFFDAVSMALVTVPLLDRRQVAIVLSDAIDNESFFDEVTMLDIARRTDAVVYTVLPGDAIGSRALSISRLRAISVLTGGRLVHAPHDAAVGDALITALDEFRQSYVLRYTPAGVPLDGWHRLEVKVRDRGYRVRAKSGYFGR